MANSLAWINAGGGAFIPSQISGLIRWYDAQSLVGLNNGDDVNTWPDKSSQGINLTTFDVSPTYVSNDSTFGNVPSVQFDGTQSTSCANPALSAMTVLVAARTTDHTVSRVLVSFVDGSHVIFVDGSSTKWEYFQPFEIAFGGASANPSAAVLRYTSTAVADFRSETGAWINFDPADGYDSSGTMLVGANPPSGTNHLKGFIGEILIYNSALSDSNVNLIGNYLAARWNFTWTNL